MSGQWAPDPWGEARFRWHDGVQWTTYVDNREPSSPEGADFLSMAASTNVVDGSARTPRWVKFGVPALAVFGLAALGSLVDDSPNRQSSSIGATDDAPITVAPRDASEQTTTTELSVPSPPAALIQACTDFTPVAAYMQIPKFVDLWNAAGQDAATLHDRCLAMTEGELVLISDEREAVQSFLEAASAPVTSPQPSVAAPPPAPTAAPSAVPPPPPPPIVTEAPAPPPPPPAPACDPNYSGCVPIASDVDCAGGTGNGPAYVRGPVSVIGNDIYDLDRDGNGIACE